MPIKNESYLVLEQSLISRIYASVRRYSSGWFDALESAFNSGNYSRVEEVTDAYNPVDAIYAEQEYARLVGFQCLLFGAREFHATKHTSFAKNGAPPLLDAATEALLSGLVNAFNLNVKAPLTTKVREAISQDKEDRVQKAEAGYIAGIRKFLDGAEKDASGIGASLHTSRLSSWGFLTEAELMGYTTYRVSAILDGRTSKICEIMDGKTFTTGPAKLKLERWLTVDSADELRSLAPWPRSTQADLERLESMSDDELRASGWDTPPYHPYCRTLLRKDTSTVVVPDETSTGQLIAALALAAQQAMSSGEEQAA